MHYKHAFQKQIKIRNLLLVIIVSLILLGIYGFFMSKQSQVIWDNVWNGYNTIFTLACTISIFTICKKYYAYNIFSPIMTIIAKNTLGIYILHSIVKDLTKDYAKTTFLSTNLFTNILYTLFLFLIGIILTLIIKKTPFIRNIL